MRTKLFILTIILFFNKGTLLWSQGNHIKGNWCEQPADSVSNKIINGIVPFDNIDIVLVTHKHSDHFNEQMVIDFLKKNHKSVLICLFQVDEILKQNDDYSKISDRINFLKSENYFDSSLSVNNIRLRAMRFNHSSYFMTDSANGKTYDIHKDIENLGYLIDIDRFTIFHSGDSSPSDSLQFTKYGFTDKEIDIVFFDRIFLRREGLDLISNDFRTKNIIFMHVEPGKVGYYSSFIKSIPEMFVFTNSLERKIILK